MKNRAESVRVAYPLFHAGGGGSTPTSALQLFFRVVDFKTARAMVRIWHSRLPKLTSPQCRIAYAAEFDGIFYATAIWCRPIARALPQYEWIELQRMAIAPDAPRNTASRMLAWMVRDIRQRFADVIRLVSYQDTEVHTGTIYRAAGWKPTVCHNFSDWTKSRHRNKAQSTAAKQRWELVIK